MAKTNILVLIKTSWRRLEDVFWRRKAKANIFVLIKTSWRRLQDVFWRRRRKTSSRRLQDVFIKTNVCWDIYTLLEKCPNMEFSPVHIFTYSARKRENTDQKKNYVFVRFSHSDIYVIYKYIYVIYIYRCYINISIPPARYNPSHTVY